MKFGTNVQLLQLRTEYAATTAITDFWRYIVRHLINYTIRGMHAVITSVRVKELLFLPLLISEKNVGLKWCFQFPSHLTFVSTPPGEIKKCKFSLMFFIAVWLTRWIEWREKAYFISPSSALTKVRCGGNWKHHFKPTSFRNAYAKDY